MIFSNFLAEINHFKFPDNPVDSCAFSSKFYYGRVRDGNTYAACTRIYNYGSYNSLEYTIIYIYIYTWVEFILYAYVDTVVTITRLYYVIKVVHLKKNKR